MKSVIAGILCLLVLGASAQVMNAVAPGIGLLAQNDEQEVSNARISKNVLLNSGLKVVMQNFDFDLDFYIIDFDVSVSDGIYEFSESWKAANSRPVKNYAKFTSRQVQIMSKLKSGSRVTIENILVRGSDGRTRYLNPISLRIK